MIRRKCEKIRFEDYSDKILVNDCTLQEFAQISSLLSFASWFYFPASAFVLKCNEKPGVFCLDFEQRILQDFCLERNMRGSSLSFWLFSGKGLFDYPKNI